MNLTLFIALCVLVSLAGALVSVFNEPPMWVVVTGGIVAFAVSTALLRLPALSEVGDSSVAYWSLLCAVFSVVEALLSLVVADRLRPDRS
ncbi:hypothetical protein [Streptomyces sp. NPDC096132]|uniref:hypothetical protein n=1 Tax=Streptomyces sp. NPDC096132 TaxID=3366075 RepID=UPI0037F3203B